MQSELDGVLDSVPSTGPCADCFMLDTIKDSGPPAVDLTYSSARGRLRKFAYFWRTLEVSQFILNVIMQGYNIPFFQLPTPFVKRNNSSARENSDFVSQAVSVLLRLDLIEELACKPNIINRSVSVSTRSSGKQRLISCLIWIFVMSISLFTSRSLNARTLALPHSYLAAVEIFPDHRKFLTFSWDFGTGVFRYFQFCVLPFGLSSSPYMFTKILKPLQKSWRSQGIPIAIFLDVGLGGGLDFVSAKLIV